MAYYRALAGTPPSRIRERLRRVQAATLLIWGMQDPALVPELTDGLDNWVPNLRLERIAEAGHWVQHERPDDVNRLLLDHLGGAR